MDIPFIYSFLLVVAGAAALTYFEDERAKRLLAKRKRKKEKEKLKSLERQWDPGPPVENSSR